jgi:hypothetical protein
MRLQDPMDTGRRNTHLLGDLTDRGAFLTERQDLGVAQNQPRTAADAALLSRLGQAGLHALAEADVLRLRDHREDR